MILADKIIEMRKKNGWSQEELAEMLGVSRQSVSKWEGAQSMPDMNRIIRLAELFDVSTDYLLRDDIELPARMDLQTKSLDLPEDLPAARAVSMEEAVAFMDFRNRTANRVALGVMLCIFSPVALILLSGMIESGKSPMSEAQAMGIGLLILFAFIGTAVAIFVLESIRGSRFDYIEKETIETAYGVDGAVRERRERFRGTYAWHMVAGIVLCVVSSVPLFVSMVIAGDSHDFALTAALGLLLVLVAVGVFLIVRSNIVWETFQMLLQEGEYTASGKEENRRNEHISTIYWCTVIAVYLAYSFVTGRWDRSWIVWPVAGVFYGVVKAISGIAGKKG